MRAHYVDLSAWRYPWTNSQSLLARTPASSLLTIVAEPASSGASLARASFHTCVGEMKKRKAAPRATALPAGFTGDSPVAAVAMGVRDPGPGRPGGSGEGRWVPVRESRLAGVGGSAQHEHRTDDRVLRSG